MHICRPWPSALLPVLTLFARVVCHTLAASTPAQDALISSMEAQQTGMALVELTRHPKGSRIKIVDTVGSSTSRAIPCLPPHDVDSLSRRAGSAKRVDKGKAVMESSGTKRKNPSHYSSSSSGSGSTPHKQPVSPSARSTKSLSTSSGHRSDSEQSVNSGSSVSPHRTPPASPNYEADGEGPRPHVRFREIPSSTRSRALWPPLRPRRQHRQAIIGKKGIKVVRPLHPIVQNLMMAANGLQPADG